MIDRDYIEKRLKELQAQFDQMRANEIAIDGAMQELRNQLAIIEKEKKAEVEASADFKG
jgi:cell division protein FtsB